jgi:hypothetical protein
VAVIRLKGNVIFLSFIGAVLIVVIVATIYNHHINSKYSISNNINEIQTNLQVWENRSDEHLIPTLIQVVHLGDSDTYVAFFKHQNGNLGTAVLKEGPNKKLRIISSGYGTDTASYDCAKTSSGNYGVVYGMNPNNIISSIHVELLGDQYNYKVKIPQTPNYIVVKKLPKGISSSIASELYFFDKNNKEIDPRKI